MSISLFFCFFYWCFKEARPLPRITIQSYICVHIFCAFSKTLMPGLKIGPSLIQGYHTCLTRLSGADGQYVSAEVPSINCVRPRSSVAYSAEGLFWQGFKRIVETGWQFWAASPCSPPLMLSEEQRRAAHVTRGRKWRQEKYRLHASLTNIGPGPLTFGCQGN